MKKIFCCSLPWTTGWLDGWNWIRVFGWLVTGTSTWVPTWLSKYWTDWNYTLDVSRKSSWIPAWLYLEDQFLWYFAWHLVITLTPQVPSLLFICLGTCHADWNTDGTFAWQLYGQISWGIYRIDFVLLFLSPVGALFDSYSWNNFLQFIMDIPPGSKVTYPDLVGNLLRYTPAVPTSVSCPIFPPPPYRTWLTSSSRATLAAALSGGWPTLPRRSGRS